MNQDKMELTAEDSFLIVKFLGKGSAQFTIHPANVVPAQFLVAADILKKMAYDMIDEQTKKRTENQIMVPKPNIDLKLK